MHVTLEFWLGLDDFECLFLAFWPRMTMPQMVEWLIFCQRFWKLSEIWPQTPFIRVFLAALVEEGLCYLHRRMVVSTEIICTLLEHHQTCFCLKNNTLRESFCHNKTLLKFVFNPNHRTLWDNRQAFIFLQLFFW